MKALLLISVVVGTASAARAEWHFCLAADHPQRRVYITSPFSSNAPSATLDDELEAELRRQNIPHDNVQCPRADEQVDAVAMRQHAMRFNRSFGTEVRDLDWMPDSTVARAPSLR